jgi:hypothetical protein
MISNEAAFGTDYFRRTAVAKSNIFVNAPNETKSFYQDLDSNGAWLNGANRYTVTFAKDATPPVNGFWSLTLYNQYHFFAPKVEKADLLPLALYAATALPLMVAITEIGVATGRMRTENAAALVGAAMLYVLPSPLSALIRRRRGQSRSPVAGHSAGRGA